jgi:hypothetical protein
MATVESIIQDLSKHDPKEHLLVIYWDKKLCKNWVTETLESLKELHNLTDDETQKMFDECWEYVTDDSYETGEVGDAIITSLKEGMLEYARDLSSELNQDDEISLWDKE